MAKKKASSAWTESRLYGLLERKFSMPGHAVFRQVADNPTRPRRYADALVMGLWRSHGYYLQGVEIKCRRSDLLSELRNPAKADEIMRYCDYWWLLAAPDIVSVEEVPETWGLMTVAKNKQGLRVVKKPKWLEPPAVPRTFLASVLRRSAEQRAEMESKVNTEVNRRMGEKKLITEEDADRRVSGVLHDYQTLQRKVHEFERAFGASITDTPDREGLGHAAKLLQSVIGDGPWYGRVTSALQQVQRQTDEASQRITEAIESLRQLRGFNEEDADNGT